MIIIGEVIATATPTNLIFKDGWCSQAAHTNPLFVRAAWDHPCNYVICKNGSVGTAGQTTPTNRLQPPLQIFIVVVNLGIGRIVVETDVQEVVKAIKSNSIVGHLVEVKSLLVSNFLFVLVCVYW